MRTFVLLLTLLAFGCTSCAHTKPKTWDPMGDSDAAYAQELMQETVQVDHRVTVLVPDPDSMKEGMSPKDMKLVPRQTGGSGTGVVVAVSKDESLIVTAAHVCKPMETIKVEIFPGLALETPVLGEDYQVWTIDLDKLPAEVVTFDEEHDLCVMKVKGKAGKPAALVERHVPVGAKVTSVGSPLGFLNYHRAFVADGRYVGINYNAQTKEHTESVAVPTTNGCSGGGVFYQGRLMGLMLSVNKQFEEIVRVQGDKPLQDIIKKARGMWHQ